MGDVTGVRAGPGGRVTLRFTADGYRAIPRRHAVDHLLGDVAAGVSVVALIVLGGIAAHRWGSPDAVVLAAACVPFALVLLVRAAVEIAGMAALVGVVLLLPLLVFPGVRRWARARWKKETVSPPVSRTIPVTAVEPVSVRHEGGSVTVVVLVDGQHVSYTGDAALERGFRALLSGRATGIGPQ